MIGQIGMFFSLKPSAPKEKLFLKIWAQLTQPFMRTNSLTYYCFSTKFRLESISHLVLSICGCTVRTISKTSSKQSYAWKRSSPIIVEKWSFLLISALFSAHKTKKLGAYNQRYIWSSVFVDKRKATFETILRN